MENVNIKLVNPQKGYVSLPFTNDQLSQFIKSLLGTPQTISKKIKGVFVIQPDDIQSFNDLICQRVAQQNESQLIEVKSTIYFSDKSNITLNSYQDLISYYELKPLLSIGIRITWSFLIKFPNKTTPERQEIELFYSVNRNNRKYLDSSDEGYFSIEIRHTQRTWGVDIENIIENQIESIKKNVSRLKMFIKKGSTIISFFIAFLIISPFAYNFLSTKRDYFDKQKDELYYYIDHNKDIGKKIDYTMKEIIIDKMPNKTYLDDIITVLIIIPIVLSLSLWIKAMASKMPKSFLIFSRKSNDEYLKYKKIRNRDWIMFWISTIFGILAGIFSNYLNGIIINLSH